METFTSLENRLQELSKSLKSLEKIEADDKKAYEKAFEKLQQSNKNVNNVKFEIEPLKNSLIAMYGKKLDILTR
jgi:predicted  nucleic acid-binding Zn-ribbon protein